MVLGDPWERVVQHPLIGLRTAGLERTLLEYVPYYLYQPFLKSERHITAYYYRLF